MTQIADLAKKYRRALRNEQGTSFTADQLRQLADMGLLEMLQSAEAEELRAKWADRSSGHTQSATSGSPKGQSRRSGRSHGTTRTAELRGIEALVANG